MKKSICFFIISFVVLPVSSKDTPATSIAMLHYLTMQSRIIYTIQNNRVALEGVYDSLLNNTDPTIIDSYTQEQVQAMLDRIQDFRMIALQRERLHFLLENAQAQAIYQALPNPLFLLRTRNLNPLSNLVAIGAMAIDSIFKYQNAKNSSQIAFLKENWVLDDKEANGLHQLRTGIWSYMVNIAREHKLETKDTLNEPSIDKFVSHKSDTNLQRKRQFLESNQTLYANYGPYWLDAAEVYYQLGMYQACLNAVRHYEAIQAPIFRKDYDYAHVLPMAIIAASQVYTDNPNDITQQATRYVLITRYVEKLIEHTDENQWVLRYFAAQTYIGLTAGANKDLYFKAAYNLLLNNVRILSVEQEKMLNTYYKGIDEQLLNSLTKEQQFKAQSFIKQLKDYRKKELPPFSDALWINYLTLERVKDEIGISSQEWNEVLHITHKAFLLDVKERCSKEEFNISFSDGFFSGNNSYYLNVPDALLAGSPSISIELREGTPDSAVSWRDDDVQIEVENVDRNAFKDPRIFRAELKLLTKSSFKVETSIPFFPSKKVYYLDIYLNREHGYKTRLHFARPAGENDWKFRYTE